MNITCESEPDTLCILIDDILHIFINKRELVGINSWRHNNTDYKIEICFKNADPMLVEYDNREKWGQVLKLLNDNV